MSFTNDRLWATLCEFSDMFGVYRPQRGNLSTWWEQSLKEMKSEDVYLICKAFKDIETSCNNNNRMLRLMREAAEARINRIPT